jgi:hypothetical protein
MNLSRKSLEERGEEYYGLAAKETDPELKASRIAVAEYYLKKHADRYDREGRLERFMADLRMARVEPWDSTLNPETLIHDTNDVGDILANNMLSDLQLRGISRIRITAQSPEGYVVKSLAKLIGPLTLSQNNFDKDVIQLIEPKATGAANSGNTLTDLGLHVDGTQHDATPAMLIFHYVAEAKIGANSVFVDGAKVLLDIDEERRNEILVNLARPDAATFSKKGMEHTGPIFYFAPTGSLVCRIRFDEVIQVHSDCRADYDFLNERYNDPRYSIEFKPREGDIVVFDNWRVLHARDEVFGMHVRRHWRGWLSNLKPTLQPNYYLGIRPFSTKIAAQIEAANRD